ncbi:MAG: hypothetical protein J7K26_02320 [Candidatus Aenigmarchaeota archaeon]|nr:hypothetical protein [Candidatus Aenigmarchaeota archaeon]
MQKSKFIALVLLLLIPIVFVSGCNRKPEPYTPDIELHLSENPINVISGQLSSKTEILTVIKRDSEEIPVICLIKFEPSDKEDVYATQDSTPLNEQETDELRYENQQYPIYFRVFARTKGNQTSAGYYINISAYCNETFVTSEILNVNVEIS